MISEKGVQSTCIRNFQCSLFILPLADKVGALHPYDIECAVLDSPSF